MEKTIKIKPEHRRDIYNLHREAFIAYRGVETANKIHFEAQERLWAKIKKLYPTTIGDTDAIYRHTDHIIKYYTKPKNTTKKEAQKNA